MAGFWRYVLDCEYSCDKSFWYQLRFRQTAIFLNLKRATELIFPKKNQALSITGPKNILCFKNFCRGSVNGCDWLWNQTYLQALQYIQPFLLLQSRLAIRHSRYRCSDSHNRGLNFLSGLGSTVHGVQVECEVARFLAEVKIFQGGPEIRRYTQSMVCYLA